MLRDEGVVVESSWGGLGGGARDRSEPHREIDRELRRIARSKAELDAEEARWLREAERHRIWRKLGFSTALEYLESVFGYAPRTGKDRLRVAKALGELPALDAELRRGALPYSAARELSRVMTPATEAQWLAHARGKSAHDVQALVCGHKKGDTPTDPKDPALMLRDVVFKLDPRRDALLQQARAMFEKERGEYIDDAALLEALCLRALGGVGTDACSDEPAEPQARASRPMQQVVIRTCDQCSRAWQQGRGALHELTASDVALSQCDAEVVRDADVAAAQAAGRRRPAPTLTVPSKTRDLVWARDCGRCRFPSCRATRNLAVHHIVHRAQGGGHDEWNLLLLCDGHHKLLHDNIVTITGRAPDQLAFTRDGSALVDPRSPMQVQRSAELRAAARAHATSAAGSRFDNVVTLEHAKHALLQLGFKAREAKRALEDARAHVGRNADVPALVKAVLAQTRASTTDDGSDHVTLATQALVQSGFSRPVAAQAVAAACAHVGTDAALATLIADAFRRCRDS